jgi:hypothetical protein
MQTDVNGTRLWFDVDGPARVPDGSEMRQRPTVVLVHGGPGVYDHSYFKPDFAPLAGQAGSIVRVCSFRTTVVDPVSLNVNHAHGLQLGIPPATITWRDGREAPTTGSFTVTTPHAGTKKTLASTRRLWAA